MIVIFSQKSSLGTPNVGIATPLRLISTVVWLDVYFNIDYVTSFTDYIHDQY